MNRLSHTYRLRWGLASAFLLGLATLTAAPFAAKADTLEDVQNRGTLRCGVSQGLPGFSNPDDRGRWTGMDVDFCRALAAAVLGNADKVSFTPLSAKDRFTALQSGDIDILSRNTTWTAQRDSRLGFDFVGILFYDGQAFMARKRSGVRSVKDLNGASVCANAGTTTELNAADYFRTNNIDYEMVTFEKSDEAVAAYNAGRCDVYTTDASGLYAQRLKLAKPDAHMILPETISKEPLGPVVRQNDAVWADIARWTLFAMIAAEELDVSSKNVFRETRSKNPSVRRLLGEENAIGEDLGLDRQWAYRIIRQVGNYGEVFERNLGEKTPLKIARGLNKLWTEGGLHYAPPIR